MQRARMPTARDATIAILQREIAASAIISSFALAVSGKGRPGDRLTYCFSVNDIILLPFDVRIYISRRHQPHGVARRDVQQRTASKTWFTCKKWLEIISRGE